MLVVLDTTLLVSDRFLESNATHLLLWQSRLGHLSIVVSEVTVREAVANYRQHAESAVSDVQSALTKLRRLRIEYEGGDKRLDAEAVTQAYEHNLRNKLLDAQATILPIPDIGHDAMVARALERKKPFDSKGHVGYRDALIWETVKGLATGRQEEIAFISTNHKDFSESGRRSGLADVLSDELRDVGVTAPVKLYDDLDHFLDHHIRPAVTVMDDVRELLEAEGPFRKDLASAIEQAIDDGDPGIDELKPRSLVPDHDEEYEVEEAVLHSVSPGVSHLDVSSARLTGNDEALLTLEAEADVDVDFHIWREVSPRRSWRYTIDDTAWDEDRERQPRSLSGTETQTVSLTVEATYNRVLKTTRAVRVVSARSI